MTYFSFLTIYFFVCNFPNKMETNFLKRSQIIYCCDKVSHIWFNSQHKTNPKRNSILLPQETKKSIGKTKNSMRNHVCIQKCFLSPIRFKLFKKKNPLFLHLCIKGICNTFEKDKERHYELIHDEQYLLVCKKNGKYHLCGKMCENIEHDRCTITKRKFEEATDILTDENIKLWKESAIKIWRETFLRGVLLPFEGFHECIFSFIPGEEGYVNEEKKLQIQRSIESKIDFKGKGFSNQNSLPLLNSNSNSLAIQERKKTKLIIPGCELVHVPVIIYGNSKNKDIHLCVKSICSIPHPNMKEKLKINNIYICRSTGKPHYCGEDCDKAVENKEGMMVCQFTGMCKNEIVQKSNNFSNTSEQSTMRSGFVPQNQNEQGKAEKYTMNSAFFLNKNQLVSLEKNNGSLKGDRAVLFFLKKNPNIFI